MFLTKKHLSRRTVLAGAGAAIALPLLDAMIPAHTAFAKTAAAVKPRLGFVYFPHGAVEKFWHPKSTGRGLRVLADPEAAGADARLRHVVHGPAQQAAARARIPHGITELTWLTRARLRSCGTLAAARPASRSTRSSRRQIGQDTPLPSLELCAEPGGVSRRSTRR